MTACRLAVCALALVAACGGDRDSERRDGPVAAVDASTPSDAPPLPSDAPPPPPADASPPDAAPLPGAELWRTAGVFVYDPKTFPAAAYGPILQANHFGWVAVQILDGSTEDWPCTSTPCSTDSAEGFMASWRPYVRYVGAWGVNRANANQDVVRAEAQTLLDLLARYDAYDGGAARADFYIADAEYEYEYSSCGACYSASDWWTAEFRAVRPASTFEASLSSLGRTDLFDLGWMSWRDQSFRFLPQCYWNYPPAGATYRPSSCVDYARVCPGSADATAKGLDCVGSPTDCPCWAVDAVHPTIGFGWGVSPPTIDDYIADLAAAKTRFGAVGFSLFEGQYLPTGSDAWTRLGQAIVDDGIAELP